MPNNFTGNSTWHNVPNGTTNVTLSNDNWSLQIFNYAELSVGRISGKYAGAGFIYLPYFFGIPDTLHIAPGSIFCAERHSNGLVFNQPDGAFCEKIMNGTFDSVQGGIYVYKLTY